MTRSSTPKKDGVIQFKGKELRLELRARHEKRRRGWKGKGTASKEPDTIEYFDETAADEEDGEEATDEMTTSISEILQRLESDTDIEEEEKEEKNSRKRPAANEDDRCPKKVKVDVHRLDDPSPCKNVEQGNTIVSGEQNRTEDQNLHKNRDESKEERNIADVEQDTDTDQYSESDLNDEKKSEEIAKEESIEDGGNNSNQKTEIAEDSNGATQKESDEISKDDSMKQTEVVTEDSNADTEKKSDNDEVSKEESIEAARNDSSQKTDIVTEDSNADSEKKSDSIEVSKEEIIEVGGNDTNKNTEQLNESKEDETKEKDKETGTEFKTDSMQIGDKEVAEGTEQNRKEQNITEISPEKTDETENVVEPSSETSRPAEEDDSVQEIGADEQVGRRKKRVTSFT